MSDLIRRDDLILFMKNWGKRRGQEEAADSFLYAISNAPAVDAVAVVRCRNCIHLFSIIFGSYCQLLGKQMEKDDYCSYGERRENNEID